jgi:hypothetical protein
MASIGCLAWAAQALALFFLLRRVLGDLLASAISLAVAAGAAGSAQWVALETHAAVALAVVKFQRVPFSEYLLHAFQALPDSFLPFDTSVPAAVIAWLLALTGAAILVFKDRALWVLPAYGSAHLAAYWNGARDGAYRKTADLLLTHTQAGDVIASDGVGAFGYYTELPMYDLGGLITTNPSLKSNVPGLRWFVANRNFLTRPQETHPTRIFEEAGFKVFAFRAGAKAHDVGEPTL